LLLSSTGYDSKGYRRLFLPEFDSPANNNGIAQDADTDKFHSSFASADYRDFVIHAAYSSREKRIPTAAFDTIFDDRRTLTTDTRFYVDPQYRHSFESALELTARAFYDRYKYDAVYAEHSVDLAEQSVILNQDFARGEWLGFELDVSKHLLKKHRVTVGTEERFNLREVQGNYDLQPYALFVFDNRSSSVSAVYPQDEFTIRKNIKLFAG
jgi:outer membrane receptor for ferrienterochelin and colicins